MFRQEESCGCCIYYMASTKVCRRHPPLPILIGIDQGGNGLSGLATMAPKPVVATYFPSMTPQGWCGEFEGFPEEINNHAGNS